MANVLEEPSAEDHYLLGPGRHLLHTGRRRGLSQGPPPSGDAPLTVRPFCRGGLSVLYRGEDDCFLSANPNQVMLFARCAVVMSALGQKRTCQPMSGMSALPPKADIRIASDYVRRSSSGSLAM